MSETVPVPLFEQCDSVVDLLITDACDLKSLGFAVTLVMSDVTSPAPSGGARYCVNPGPRVGHLQLQTGTVVTISPKYPAAVLRMLAYVYSVYDRSVFRDEIVEYATDRLLFEPLVELFNQLVEDRVRQGLVHDYLPNEDNLRVLRGRIDFGRQLSLNQDRPDRLSCRFFERTADTEDNQIVKWTLQRLRWAGGWRRRTEEELRKNLLAFDGVSLIRPRLLNVGTRTYDRLHDDYRLLHELCRMFLEGEAFSEAVGQLRFRGFLLNMDCLYERFVTRGFENAALGSDMSVRAQEWNQLSTAPYEVVRIRPDVIVRRFGKICCVADAKYTLEQIENEHVYQVLAYAIALDCRYVFLVYPAGLKPNAKRAYVSGAAVTICPCQVDLTGDCVANLRLTVDTVLTPMPGAISGSRSVS